MVRSRARTEKTACEVLIIIFSFRNGCEARDQAGHLLHCLCNRESFSLWEETAGSRDETEIGTRGNGALDPIQAGAIMSGMKAPRRVSWMVAVAIFLGAGRAPAATSDVNVGPSLAFSPSSVEIQAGDTVKWTWKASNHSVTSGVPGQPSGLFDSGVHSTNNVFSFTFPERRNNSLLLLGARGLLRNDRISRCRCAQPNAHADAPAALAIAVTQYFHSAASADRR